VVDQNSVHYNRISLASCYGSQVARACLYSFALYWRTEQTITTLLHQMISMRKQMTVDCCQRRYFRLHRMHEMQTIVTDDPGVYPSVCLSRGSTLCGEFVQPLPNYFGLLF